MTEQLLRHGETADGALGGVLRVIQPATGYRFSVDALLLAGFAAEQPAVRVVDLGCGSGVVGLSLLVKGGAETLLGLDIQAEFVDRASRSALWNGWEAQSEFRQMDIRELPASLPKAAADLVVSNPPYRPVGEGRISPDPSVAVARHELELTLPDVFAAAFHLLGLGGSCCLIYPAYRLAALFGSCRDAGLKPERLRLVHPRLGDPAHLVLLRARKGKCEGLEISSPLILHGPRGGEEKYSREARCLLGLP